MLLTIEVLDPDDGPVLRDLFRWLRDDEDVHAEVSLTAEPVPGAMSGGLDIVNVVLTHSIGAANLALAYAGWRTARRSRAVLTFTRPSDGLTVTVDGGSDEAVRALAGFIDDLTVPPEGAPAPGPGDPGDPDGSAPGAA
ncbi:hypothetical protein ACH4E8_13395 [Streptomyces sp. NPDC017979]|uniref:effector-associated constant component EACC1 n=1 Tax=Streptomyces sp. NPDC017979 TaxID=3365024 RepID=UPI00378A1CD8